MSILRGSGAVGSLVELRRCFPRAFTNDFQPLALDIAKQMRIDPDNPALRWWTGHPRYLCNVIRNIPRIGIDGYPAIPQPGGFGARERAKTQLFEAVGKYCQHPGSGTHHTVNLELWLRDPSQPGAVTTTEIAPKVEAPRLRLAAAKARIPKRTTRLKARAKKAKAKRR
jgi:hypothetical protein